MKKFGVKKLKTKQEIYEHLKELKWIVKNMDYPPNEMTQEDYNIICAEIEVLEWILCTSAHFTNNGFSTMLYEGTPT